MALKSRKKRVEAPAISRRRKAKFHADLELPDRPSLKPQPDNGAALGGFKTGLCRTRTGILPRSGLPANELAISDLELPDRPSLKPQPDNGAALGGFKTGLCRTRTGILPRSGLPANELAISTAPSQLPHHP